MKVVILCGGKGTRLREETEFKPKPLVDVLGRPILWHIMKGYGTAGLNEFVLCLGHKGEMIRDYFLHYSNSRRTSSSSSGRGAPRVRGRGRRGGLAHHVRRHRRADQHGRRIKRVADHIDGDTFMATYGDGVSDIDVDALLHFHESHGRLATITGVHPWSKYGQMDVDSDGVVSHFIEKPRLHEYINGGFFVFDRRVLDYLDDDCVLEREPFERLAAERQLVMYRHEGFWHCMDTYKDYEELNAYEYATAPWRTW